MKLNSKDIDKVKSWIKTHEKIIFKIEFFIYFFALIYDILIIIFKLNEALVVIAFMLSLLRLSLTIFDCIIYTKIIKEYLQKCLMIQMMFAAVFMSMSISIFRDTTIHHLPLIVSVLPAIINFLLLSLMNFNLITNKKEVAK